MSPAEEIQSARRTALFIAVMCALSTVAAALQSRWDIAGQLIVPGGACFAGWLVSRRR